MSMEQIIAMLKAHLRDLDHASFMFGELPGQDMTRRVLYRLESLALNQ